jgi:UDP-N-acetylmuramoyl-L-alanyl-D-glutamate--2,6-diaminopimelate ligase
VEVTGTKTKRPKWLKSPMNLSDVLILTSDNPRNEKPSDILKDMLKGVEKEDESKIFTNRRPQARH